MRWLIWTLTSCVVVLTAGCATMGGDYCDHARTITLTANDVEMVSTHLLRQVVRHNEVHEALCR